MLTELGMGSMEQLIELVVPQSIQVNTLATLGSAKTENQALTELKSIATKNQIFKSYIGLGYHDTFTPNVILRNVLENPGWYTAYTPYQPEISQGRLEGLLTFQQMITDLSGLDLANASMLDEATAAAEAMAMSKRVAKRNPSNTYFVSEDVHPQTIEVVKTRAKHFGFKVVIGCPDKELEKHDFFGALLQYPGSSGEVKDLSPLIEAAHQKQAIVTVAADILAMVILKSPGSMGADIVVGSNQRFGIPLGCGGPHAAFFAFRDAYKRSAPGRIIGASIDSRGKYALRMAMQTREQHIRREKANSNICTSQVLLALISAFYAMYHGPEGLKAIALRVHTLTKSLSLGLKSLGYSLNHEQFFDTLSVDVGDAQQRLITAALNQGLNFRALGNTALGLSLNETTSEADLEAILAIFAQGQKTDLNALLDQADSAVVLLSDALRQDEVLTHPSFKKYHSETEMLRYLKRLETKDIALNHAMIPLGSCTMKLNATAEMIPVTWPEFSRIHPFAPKEQIQGYLELFEQLDSMLQTCTGYDAISLQPNAGSQGEYAGLIAIKRFFESKGESQRNMVLIPASAHGTNPASAQMAGMGVKVVACDDKGNVDKADLQQKVTDLGDTVAALMVTYPSTHGVFEEDIVEICEIIHQAGGQVYIDGANMNAMVGLAAFGKFGGDVSHLNLHKTFCIPHGGGGPGMGPIGVKNHLAPFLPSHPLQEIEGTDLENGVISAAPWGSASILPISWMYIKMMGADGMKHASEIAVLNANYIAKRLNPHFPILYTGSKGLVAHECLLDLRPLKEKSGVTEEDIAKRLMDFGFHAPTMSFPVAGTLMIEPTESESKAELDRFCEAMIQIRNEISAIETGTWPTDNNPLKNAPHTLDDLMEEPWSRPYTREQAVRPLPYLKEHKYWPSVNRIDNVYGDRNLVCSCPSIEEYR